MADLTGWREVAEDPRYMVSPGGRVRGPRGWILTQVVGPRGYAQVSLGRNRKRMVHQLVCIAFHGPRPTPKHVAAHWNGIPTDNRAVNLRWATQSENMLDSVRHGTCPLLTRFPGEVNSQAKFTWEQAHGESA